MSSARGEGPSSTVPATPKAERWHGHLNLPAAASKSTAQPRCGHTVENAVSLPSTSTTHADPIFTSFTRFHASTRSAWTSTRTGAWPNEPRLPTVKKSPPDDVTSSVSGKAK